MVRYLKKHIEIANKDHEDIYDGHLGCVTPNCECDCKSCKRFKAAWDWKLFLEDIEVEEIEK